MDEPADLFVESALPDFDCDGSGEDAGGKKAEPRLFRAEDFLQGIARELETDHKNHDGDNQPADIFNPRVPVRVLAVGGLRRHAEPRQRHDGSRRIAQVVHGVGRDGDAAGKDPRSDFGREKKQVGHDADHAGKFAVPLPRPGAGSVPAIPDKQPD